MQHTDAQFIEDWLTSNRLKRLHKDFDTARRSLALTGLLPAAVRGWIRQEVARDIEWQQEERTKLADSLREEWLKHNRIEELGLKEPELLEHLTLSEGVHRWSASQWGDQLESFFLANKQDYDQASFFLLRTSDLNLAIELYHQLKAGESTFQELSVKHGEGKEASRGGYYSLTRLRDVPYSLAPILRTMSPSQVKPPMQLGRRLGIVKLENYIAAEYSSEVQRKLLKERFTSWQDAMTNRILALLSSEIDSGRVSESVAEVHRPGSL